MAKRLCAGGLDAHWSLLRSQKVSLFPRASSNYSSGQRLLASHQKDVWIGEVRMVDPTSHMMQAITHDRCDRTRLTIKERDG